jgi:hypothetical protein
VEQASRLSLTWKTNFEPLFEPLMDADGAKAES